jgi:hypothetical protein
MYESKQGDWLDLICVCVCVCDCEQFLCLKHPTQVVLVEVQWCVGGMTGGGECRWMSLSKID